MLSSLSIDSQFLALYAFDWLSAFGSQLSALSFQLSAFGSHLSSLRSLGWRSCAEEHRNATMELSLFCLLLNAPEVITSYTSEKIFLVTLATHLPLLETDACY